MKCAEEIHTILRTKSFRFSKFRTRDIFERGKKRHLCYTITYPDRVVQHAVLQVVGPILLGTSIRDSYAAQKGKGTHMCSMRVRTDIYTDPEGTKYYLKEDISKYFDNIPRKKLFELVKRKIKDRDALDLIHTFIFDAPGRRGLPIGMYSSQIFSSFMLTYFDHWVKEVLRVKHYYRYMDDMVFLSSDKNRLRRIHLSIKAKLESEYGLKLKGNWRIAPVATGLDFVGYVHRPDHVSLRKRNKIRYKKVCRRILGLLHRRCEPGMHDLASACSYDGMAGWCDGRRLRHLNYEQVIRRLVLLHDTQRNSQRNAGGQACQHRDQRRFGLYPRRYHPQVRRGGWEGLRVLGVHRGRPHTHRVRCHPRVCACHILRCMG